MCGRFALPPSAIVRMDDELEAVWTGPAPEPRYNVCPRGIAPVLRLTDGGRVLGTMRWGLIPGWAKDPAIGDRCFNARGETAHEKPVFRSAFRARRCLVPIGGFFEWQRVPGQKRKQPWYIYPADGSLLVVAGLWESWRPDPETEPVLSFTVLTTTPNAFMAGLHDRMPVILTGEDRDAWLDPAAPAADLRALIRPGPDGLLTAHRVATTVNVPSADGADLIEPLEDPPTDQPMLPLAT